MVEVWFTLFVGDHQDGLKGCVDVDEGATIYCLCQAVKAEFSNTLKLFDAGNLRVVCSPTFGTASATATTAAPDISLSTPLHTALDLDLRTHGGTIEVPLTVRAEYPIHGKE
jgi:hypothetical protein